MSQNLKHLALCNLIPYEFIYDDIGLNKSNLFFYLKKSNKCGKIIFYSFWKIMLKNEKNVKLQMEV